MKKSIITLLLLVQFTISAEESSNEMLLIPFKAFSYIADYHIIGFPEDHKTIESIEAFIFKRDDSYMFRAIVTGHDKKQKDFVNSKQLLTKHEMISSGKQRDIELVDGYFEISNSENKCKLIFDTDDYKRIELHYWGHNSPDKKYGALTDPMGHSPDSGLPIMIRSKSSIGKEESYIVIDNIKQKIERDRDASEPPWFTAARVYLTEDYFFAMIPSYTKEEEPLKLSEVEINNSSFSYTTDNDVRKVYLDEASPDNRVEKIRYYCSYIKDKSSYLDLTFEPSLPNLISMEAGESVSVGFSIRYNLSDKKEIFGKLNITRNNNQFISLELNPEFPLWAKTNRNMIYEINLSSDKTTITGRIKK